MQSYILVRGVKKEVEIFENDLSAQWTRYELHGKQHALKVGVRTIKILELAYPEAAYDDVMKMLMPFGRYKSDIIGKGLYFLLLPFVKAIGMFKNTTKSLVKYHNYKVFHPFVDVIVFGHKPDRKDANGTEKI